MLFIDVCLCLVQHQIIVVCRHINNTLIEEQYLLDCWLCVSCVVAHLSFISWQLHYLCWHTHNMVCSTCYTQSDWHCWTKTGAGACSLGCHPSITAGCSWTNPNMVELLGQEHPPCKQKKNSIKASNFYFSS